MHTEPKGKYYHVTCIECLLPNLADLVRDGHLQMDGYISAPVDSKVSFKLSVEMIADWFKYGGRTFDLECYENYNKNYCEWEADWCGRWIAHQLAHGEQLDNACDFCQFSPIPEEPKKLDYFPEEPSVILLSQLLVSVIGQPPIAK